MFGKIILAAALALPMLATASPAYVDIEQRLTAEQRHATGLDTLKPDQLALLNKLLREDAVQTAESAPTPQEEQAARGGSFVGMDVEPIKSRLKGTVTGWEPGTVFELENGQRWKVLKGYMKLRKPIEAPEIQVIPGFAGRWFLQVDEDLPKSRVYRID